MFKRLNVFVNFISCLKKNCTQLFTLNDFLKLHFFVTENLNQSRQLVAYMSAKQKTKMPYKRPKITQQTILV